MKRVEFNNKYRELITEILDSQLDILYSDEALVYDEEMLAVLITLFNISLENEEINNILYEVFKDYRNVISNYKNKGLS